MPTHRSYQRNIPLLLYGDLSDEEHRELERHIEQCPDCRAELESTRALHALLGRVPAPAPTEQLLRDARLRFNASVSGSIRRQSIVERIRGLVPFEPRPAYALAMFAIAALAFAAGRLLSPSPSGTAPAEEYLAMEKGYRVTNVRFVNGDGPGGTLELMFDAVKPVRIQGTLDDPDIQKVLAYALVNGENAGVRIRAANSVSGARPAMPEPEVKAALLLALRNDTNDGVRKQALTALLRYEPDREVRDALLYTLLNDANPALRIAAIDGLDSLRARGHRPDEEMLQTFKERMNNDDNMYVRVKARSLMEEKIQ